MSADQRQRLRLGQNLFVSAAPARALVAAADLAPGDTVYDLGAGTGAVTAALLERDVRVIAVEYDANLARKLRSRFAGRPVVVLEADLRAVRFRAPFKVVANPPFNATADLMRRLMNASHPPQSAALVLQREAAEKYGHRLSAVSLAARPWFDVEVSRPFSRRDFVPIPEVEVALLRLRQKTAPDLAHGDADAWRAFVRYALARPRPDAWRTFRGLVSNLQWRRLSQHLGVAPAANRADLSYAQWLAIFRFASRCAPPEKLRRLDSDWAGGHRSLANERRPARPFRNVSGQK